MHLNHETKIHTREKCFQCMRPEDFCLCSSLNSINTKTRFVILMHPMEFKKEKIGTGRLTHLQLKNSEIVVEVDFTNNKRVNDFIQDQNNICYVLYPGTESLNISKDCSELKKNEEKTNVIFLIDATWPCAKKMYKLSKNLHKLASLSFENDSLSKFKIKQQPHPLCLSTIESTLKVLEILKLNKIESCDTQDFLKPFERMIELQINCIENPPGHSYRKGISKKLKEKNVYKSAKARSSFFTQSSTTE